MKTTTKGTIMNLAASILAFTAGAAALASNLMLLYKLTELRDEFEEAVDALKQNATEGKQKLIKALQNLDI